MSGVTILKDCVIHGGRIWVESLIGKGSMLTVRKQGIDKVHGQHVLKADDYVTKPFGRKDLMERFKKMVEP